MRWLFHCEFCLWMKVNTYLYCSRVEVCGFISPKITFWNEISSAESHFLRFFFSFIWICILNFIWLIGACNIYCCVCFKSKSAPTCCWSTTALQLSHTVRAVVFSMRLEMRLTGSLVAPKSGFTCFPFLTSHNERRMPGYLTTRFSFLGWEQKRWLLSGPLGILRVQVVPYSILLSTNPLNWDDGL